MRVLDSGKDIFPMGLKQKTAASGEAAVVIKRNLIKTV